MNLLQRLWLHVGHWLFWLSRPVLWLYLGHSRRVRILIVCADELLLTQNWLGDTAWSLPGGGRRHDETPELTVQRELLEEIGLKLSTVSLQPLGERQLRQTWPSFHYDLFIVRLESKPTLHLRRLEITAAQWFGLNKIPSIKTTPEVLPALHDLKALFLP